MDNKNNSIIYNIIGGLSSILAILVCLQRYLNISVNIVNVFLILSLIGNLIVLNNLHKLYFKDSVQKYNLIKNIKIVMSTIIILSVTVRLIDLL